MSGAAGTDCSETRSRRSCGGPNPSRCISSTRVQAPGMKRRATSSALSRTPSLPVIRGASGTCCGRDCWSTSVSGRNDIVQSWLASFSDVEIAAHAPLALCAAYSSVVGGDAAHARHWAIAAAARWRRSRGPALAQLAAGLTGFEALLPAGGVTSMAAAAAGALALDSPASPWCPVWLFLRATALHLTGDLTGVATGSGRRAWTWPPPPRRRSFRSAWRKVR